MTAKLTIDKAGRIVIPKPLREELHLAPGDELELDSFGDQITLRPVREPSPLRKEDGMWVFRTGTRIPASTTNEILEQLRSGREI
jgi:AbrB family looped-hinge helix DNA binding protein